MRGAFARLWEKVKKARAGKGRYPLEETNKLVRRYVSLRVRGRHWLPPIVFAEAPHRDALGLTEHLRHGASRISVFDDNLHSADELAETLLHEAAHWLVNSHFSEEKRSVCCCCACAEGRGHGHDDVWCALFNHLFPVQ